MEGASDRMWIVDPIDGTRNYAAGHPDLGEPLVAQGGGRVRPGTGERSRDRRALRGGPRHGGHVERRTDARVARGPDRGRHGRVRRCRGVDRDTAARPVHGTRGRRPTQPGVRRLLGSHAGGAGSRGRHDRAPALGVGLRAARGDRGGGGRPRDAGRRLATRARRQPGHVERARPRRGARGPRCRAPPRWRSDLDQVAALAGVRHHDVRGRHVLHPDAGQIADRELAGRRPTGMRQRADLPQLHRLLLVDQT